VAQKFHFAILRIEVTPASRGLSAIAELRVTINILYIRDYSGHQAALLAATDFPTRVDCLHVGFITRKTVQ